MSAKESIIPVFVPHVGCPNNCVFCNQRKISGQLKPTDPGEVSGSIEKALKLIPERTTVQLAFYGGSFTAIPAEEQAALLSAAYAYVESGAIESIRLSTRPDAIDYLILDRLRRFGVKTIELGAQSLDGEVLRRSGRGHTAEDVFKASELIKTYGFRLIIQMMTGLPGDTKEKTVKTAEDICSIRPDGVRIYPTVIIRDTPLYEMWKAGKYSAHSVEEAVDYCAAIVPMFEAAGIDIIRIGLNPTDDLSSGEAAGGAYHPAFGELVRSRIMLDRMRLLLKGVSEGSRVIIYGPGNRISQMTGQHRQNIDILKAEYRLNSLKILPSEDGELRADTENMQQ